MPETPLEFDFSQLTPRMLIDFKKQVGVGLFSLLTDDGDLDLESLPEEAVAGVIWLALRMSGQEISWDEALDTPVVSLTFAEESAEPDPTSAS